MSWAEFYILAFSIACIPGVDNWQVDILSWQCLDLREMDPTPESFPGPVRGMLDVDPLTSRFDNKLEVFVSSYCILADTRMFWWLHGISTA